MQYLRELPGTDLATLANELNTDDNQWGGVTNELEVVLEGDILAFQMPGRSAIPATVDGVEQIATFIGVPRAFALNLPPDMQRYLLQELLRRNPANVGIRYTDNGIHEVFKPDRVRLEPRQIVSTAISVLGADAPLVEWRCDSDELLIDVVVPENADYGIGGDPQINDISRGGLRFRQDRKNNHAPTVNSYLYRLACTNGMVVPESGLTLDARGSTVPVLLAELELAAQHAFRQVEEQMEHFYAMRERRVEGDVTQAVIQVARERGLPDRTGMMLARRVPDQLNPSVLGREVTEFDLVNLITNQANDPALRGRFGTRRQLEQAGGRLVREVHDRCGNCHQVIA